MIERVATRLASIASENGIIPSEDHDLYIYSYQIMIERTFSWACILLVALLFETLYPYTLIFMAFFLSLSMFVGGWHAPSFRLCFVVSVGIFLGFSLVEPFVTASFPMGVAVVLITCCAVVIGVLGPVAHPNKPMDAKSIKICRKISIVIIFIQTALAVVSFAAGNERILMFIMFSFMIASASLVGGHREAKKLQKSYEMG